MGAGFVVLIWLILGGIAFAIFLFFLVLGAIGAWKKKPVLKWFGFIPAATIAAIGIFVVGALGYGFWALTQPRMVFKDMLGQKPGSKVSNIESSAYWFADTGSIYLRFDTDETTFRSLVPSELKNADIADIELHGVNHEEGAPAWWHKTPSAGWQVYFRDFDGFSSGTSGLRGFVSETEYMVYDPDSGVGYFRFLGID